MKIIKYKELNKIEQNLLSSAKKSLTNSYSPYSNFSVASALLTKNNQIITGVNVENISYGSTICAEASALVRARSMGQFNIKKIAVIAKNKKDNFTDIVAPCGNCRQLIYEFSMISNIDISIIMSNSKMTKIRIAKISELLPLAFKVKKL